MAVIGGLSIRCHFSKSCNKLPWKRRFMIELKLAARIILQDCRYGTCKWTIFLAIDPDFIQKISFSIICIENGNTFDASAEINPHFLNLISSYDLISRIKRNLSWTDFQNFFLYTIQLSARRIFSSWKSFFLTKSNFFGWFVC